VSEGNREPFGEALRLTITSDTSNVAKVRATTLETAERVGFAETDASAIALAIDEAVCNVIKHGYSGRPGNPIDILLEPVRDDNRIGLQITIRDRAAHVDPAQIMGRDLEDVRPGGLGTHIIKTVMDEVEYKHRQPEGMRLRLLKWIDSQSHIDDCQVDCSGKEKPADD